MNRPFVLLLSIVIFAGCSQTGSVATTAGITSSADLSSHGGKMELRGHAFPPPAFNAFCAAEPRLCSTRGDVKTLELTDAHMAELHAVNRAVNRRIVEQSDLQSVGREDDWRLPGKVGDCEDFAILKKHELMKRGWPASVLLLTVVTSGGEGHVVLTVRTDRGDLILDNRTDAIKEWTRAPYRFFARQSQTAPGKWDKIAAASGTS